MLSARLTPGLASGASVVSEMEDISPEPQGFLYDAEQPGHVMILKEVVIYHSATLNTLGTSMGGMGTDGDGDGTRLTSGWKLKNKIVDLAHLTYLGT